VGALFVVLPRTLLGRWLDGGLTTIFPDREFVTPAPSCQTSEGKTVKGVGSATCPLQLQILKNLVGKEKDMEIKLAEAIVEACREKGVGAVLQENYSASWMRGRKTTGVVIKGGDLAHVVSAVIASPQLFIDGELPKFDIKDNLSVSPFRLNLILY
jgi:hypothetical protein